MNASVLKRTLAIAVAVAVPWVGCSLWSARRERAEKEALAAEIQAEMAARPAEPGPAAGRLDLTKEYTAILQALGKEREPKAFDDALREGVSWDPVPAAVTDWIERKAAALAAFDALVREKPPGTFSIPMPDATWVSALARLLYARGRARAARGEFDGLFESARGLRRLADDEAASRKRFTDFYPERSAMLVELQALRLLEQAAVHPALTEAAAVSGMALAGDTSVLEAVFRENADRSREGRDRFLLGLLGEQAEEALRGMGILEDDDPLESVERLFEGRSRRRRRFHGPPPAAVLRRARDIAILMEAREDARDGAAFVLNGAGHRECTEDLGGGWTAMTLSFGPFGAISRWTSEARPPVLRAAFAARLHEIRTGRPPAALGDLVPSILDAVPVDAWTRQPVRFTRTPRGWKLEAGPPEASFTYKDGVTHATKPYRLERK